ncbi:DNA polymerase epsilon subunit C [Cladobotryum mycophilum]|uniref:DNA polymerase epsilon subunit C n=1 Tax=Cladobotryum mycophilum TaxID=491253 RepID=A0ABR0T1F3_9HYPO
MPYNTNAIPPRKEPTGQNLLPLSRVKKIISQDTDVHMCSNNAAFVITLAAEMFIQHLADEAYTQAKLERKPRRNIQYKDIANAISHQDHLEFLEDVAPKTVPFKKAKAVAFAAQARLRGEAIAEESITAVATSQSQILANGHGESNGNGTNPFTLSVREDKQKQKQQQQQDEDPNAQLELEMREAEEPKKDGADVDMTG